MGFFVADSDQDKAEAMVFDVFVIIVSVFSSFLCIRSLYRAHSLRKVSVFSSLSERLLYNLCVLSDTSLYISNQF